MAALCGLPIILALRAPASAQTGPGDADADLLRAGKALFTQTANPPCGVCHTLRHAETTGAVGPVLDELRPDAARVAMALATGLGAMPSYKPTLTPEQMALLARYVASVSGR